MTNNYLKLGVKLNKKLTIMNLVRFSVVKLTITRQNVLYIENLLFQPVFFE